MRRVAIYFGAMTLLCASALGQARPSRMTSERESQTQDREATVQAPSRAVTATTAPAVEHAAPQPTAPVTAVAESSAPGPPLALQGLTCDPAGVNGPGVQVLSASIGLSNPVNLTGGGIGSAGHPNFSALNVLRQFDECSSYLLSQSLTGMKIPKVALTYTDANGLLMEMDLEGVLIDSYQLSSSSDQSEPTESVSLLYGKITLNEKQSGTSTPACYDLIKQQSCQ